MFYLSDLLFHVIGLGWFSRPSQYLTGAFFLVRRKNIFDLQSPWKTPYF